MGRPKKKPEDSKDFKIGEKIYTASDYNGPVMSGVVKEYLSSNIIAIHFDAPWYGTAGRYAKDCYKTKEACERAVKARMEENIKGYCNEIKTVDDLVNFALANCIGPAEEYTDWAAREAFVKRAKELGITINK